MSKKKKEAAEDYAAMKQTQFCYVGRRLSDTKALEHQWYKVDSIGADGRVVLKTSYLASATKYNFKLHTSIGEIHNFPTPEENSYVVSKCEPTGKRAPEDQWREWQVADRAAQEQKKVIQHNKKKIEPAYINNTVNDLRRYTKRLNTRQRQAFVGWLIQRLL